MNQKWTTLCALILAVQTVLQAGGAEALLARLRTAAEDGTLCAAALSAELGIPAEAVRLAAVPAEKTASALRKTPAPTETPSPGAAPEETPTPEPTEEPTPPPPDEAPAVEVRVFTDMPGMPINNKTAQEADAATLMTEPLTQRLPEEGPQILIVHTHATEAYLPAPGEEYEASDPYRTLDAAHSVIRVGDVLQEELESFGLRVAHDRTLCDYPSYTDSYARSEEVVEAWLREYPDIAVVIDLHRDALGTDEVLYKTCAAVSEEQTAQVMLVVGTGENGLEHPAWRENCRLALAMQYAMDGTFPTLARPVLLARERYNQQLTTGSVILEVGTNGNTLSEALCAVRLYARSVGPLLQSLAE